MQCRQSMPCVPIQRRYKLAYNVCANELKEIRVYSTSLIHRE